MLLFVNKGGLMELNKVNRSVKMVGNGIGAVFRLGWRVLVVARSRLVSSRPSS